jgi:hypothetical protein
MHIQVIHIAIVWWLILFSRKSGEAFFMPVYTQGIHSIEKSINSQVKLQIINEVRFVDVPLDHTTLYLRVFNDSIEISCPWERPSGFTMKVFFDIFLFDLFPLTYFGAN